MKLQFPILATILMSANLFVQATEGQRLFIPYLDKESQSNVIVTACDFTPPGLPCPIQYANVISNTNLFAAEKQRRIEEIFEKYKYVTTNSGLSGTQLVGLYETNTIINTMDRTFKIENWVSYFQYTNVDAHEMVMIGKGGLLAEHRDKFGDGYDVSLIHTGDGTMLRFSEEKNNLLNGMAVSIEDMHWQNQSWDFRRAEFTTNSPLTEYRQYTNGMVCGKFLMWNPQNGNLIIEANFTEPYDLQKHMLQPQWK